MMWLTLLTITSTLIGLLATLNIFSWKKRATRGNVRAAGISIMKPIRGLEPELAANIHSFLNIESKIPFEILFCVKDPEDRCIPMIRHYIKLHPRVNAKLFTGTPDLGRNPKVSNMHTAWNMASYDLILISDSNVRVEPDYLDTLIAERQTGAGLVTQAVYGAGAKGVGGHLDVVHLNSFYLKATAFLKMFGFDCVLGKCMLFSRSQFESIGGIFAVRNYLAEDLVAGELMKEAGYKVSVAPVLLRQTTIMTSFKAYWQRHVRWARLRKCHFFFAYLIEPLLFESLWPLLLFAFASTATQRWIAVACWAAQLASNAALYKFKFHERETWRSFRWFWLKDLVAPCVWTAGLVSNSVVWRGQTLSLRFGGKLGTKYLRAARVRSIGSKIRSLKAI